MAEIEIWTNIIPLLTAVISLISALIILAAHLINRPSKAEQEKRVHSENNSSKKYLLIFSIFLIVGLIAGVVWLVYSSNYDFNAQLRKQSLTFEPTDDSFINANSPDGNMGSTNWLRVFSSSYAPIYTLIKFDISSIVKETTISSAKLKLYYYQETGEGDPSGHTLNILTITSDWTENTVTWNTKPPYKSQITSSMIVPNTPNVWMNWDVTADVKNFISGKETNYGWILIDITQGSGLPYFHSKESGSYIPYLEIN